MSIFNKPVTIELASEYFYYLDRVEDFRRATLLPVASPSEKLNLVVHGTLMYEERTELDDAFVKYMQLTGTADPAAVTREAAQDIADALADMIFIYLGYVLDHSADIIPANWVMCGIEKTATRHKIDIKRAFDLVFASNMSKLCTTDYFDATIAKYAEDSIEIEFREVPTQPGLYAAYCVHDPAGKLPKGKLLKPVNYFEPKWLEDTSWYVGE